MAHRCHGTYHELSPKHPPRQVAEFSGRHNTRPADTVQQMEGAVRRINDERLKHEDLGS